jgi:hypothetical protein
MQASRHSESTMALECPCTMGAQVEHAGSAEEAERGISKRAERGRRLDMTLPAQILNIACVVHISLRPSLQQ